MLLTGFFPEILWFLARERNPSQTIRDEVYAKLKAMNINSKLLLTTSQTGCDDEE